MTLRLRGIRFEVIDGRQIDVHATPATLARDIRVWLLGTVMAAILHQRGYLPIHANVVGLSGGGAAAFAGDSGAGKSTLAAWFASRGHRVLADDLCAVRFDELRRPLVDEGVLRTKLWADTLQAFGQPAAGLEKVASDLDKYHVPLPPAPEIAEPMRLRRLYVLGRAASGEPFSIKRLHGLEAAEAILANAFRWQLGQQILEDPRSQFDHCLTLARQASVFTVERQWGLERFAEEAQAIERHLAEPLDDDAEVAGLSPGAP